MLLCECSSEFERKVLNLIQNLRKKSGMTQEDVAKQLNVDRSTVAKWEAGESMPRAQLLPRLAQLFSCTVDELLTEVVETAEGA